jgi:ferredoxin
VRVWIDQDLCTGDGLCTDHCPSVFVLLEDGISYVRDDDHVASDPGGADDLVDVPARHEAAVIAAALDCPGECIFLEEGSAETDPEDSRQ